MQKFDTVGVRLPGQTRQRVAKHATVLSISQSSFIRVLVDLALELIDEDPSLLLKRSRSVVVSAE